MTKFSNNNLNFDIEKIKNYTIVGYNKDKFINDVHGYIFTIEINDNSYFYDNELERDEEYDRLKKLLKTTC